MRVELARDKCRIVQDALVERDRGLDAFDDEAFERALHPSDGFGAIFAMRDQLRDQRVVIGRNYAVGVRGGVDTDARAAGNTEGGDAPRGRDEGFGVFRVDAAFDGVAAEFDGRQNGLQFLAGCDSNLRFHEINAGDHFGDRMFDLDARVHFDEVEVAGLFAQEFDGARARVAQIFQRVDDLLADFVARSGVDDNGGRFLENLLVAALDGAFAFAKMHDVAVLSPRT